MNYPKALNQFPSKAGKPHRPSNGTEGMMFIEAFCDTCFHRHDCDIVWLTMSYDITDKRYPKEWIYSDEGWPICTNWQRWDGSEPPEPKPTEPDDPNQLCMNFYLPEIINQLEEA